jgi:peptidyl-prolyl cis-trans isomerase B (cyclophilin B)
MKKLLLVLAVFVQLSAAAQSKKVRIETEYGPIVLSLYDGTPLHRDNMVKLAKEKFFDSLLWHRVIPAFVIQGGDPASKRAASGTALGDGERPGVGRIPAEIKDQYYHKRGAVGMARDQNPEKASSNCQFYIVVGKKFSDAEIDAAEKRGGRKVTAAQREVYKTQGGTPHLDGGYTVFGEVVEGMDVVDKIAAEPRGAADRPTKDVRMLKVRVVRKKFLGIF